MVIISRLNGGDITITTGGSTPSEPTAPNGKVLYKTNADGEWLQSDADISDGTFSGFTEKESAVAVIIPSKDAIGNDVTSIGESAFEDCSDLTGATIPDSITSIKEKAFYGCSGLTSVIIPNSVTSIWQSAFRYCSGLTNVTIGDNVAGIGLFTFRGCSNLTSVTIPDSVTEILSHAFYDCSSLTSVTITANGGNAENVKQMIITSIENTSISDNITWNMPS